ncbi:MAG TPA: hypothetical protein VEF04_15675 [Blastocatellia bacterium]|nr:hypothetical protein [Blastocatellia bacterium]
MSDQKKSAPSKEKNEAQKTASYSSTELSPMPRKQFKANQSTTETQGARIISRA